MLTFPVQTVQFMSADELRTVGGELTAQGDVSAFIGEVEFHDFGLGQFIPLGRPRICDSAGSFSMLGRTQVSGYRIDEYLASIADNILTCMSDISCERAF